MALNWHILLLIFFLAISAFSSASETALFSLSKMKLLAFGDAKEGPKNQVAKLLKQPRELIVTILMVNIFVNLMVQNVTSAYFGDYASWVKSVGVPLVLTLFLGDLLPKIFGMAYNEKIGLFAAPIFTVIKKILSPLQKGITLIAAALARFIFFFLKKAPDVSIEELTLALGEIREGGALREETHLLAGYLRLQGAIVQDIMRSREEIRFYDIKDDPLKLINLFKDNRLSRAPVCDGGIDRILGIMTVCNFLEKDGEMVDKSRFQELLQPAYFVPESTPARVLLYQLKQHHEFFAIAVDERGSVTGVITLEDLVEEIIGDVAHPRIDKTLPTQASGDELICSGRTELTAIKDQIGLTLKSEYRQVTINGFLSEKLKQIPVEGMIYEDERAVFHVLEADNTRILRVYIRKKSEPVKNKR